MGRDAPPTICFGYPVLDLSNKTSLGGLNHVELPAVLCSWRLLFFHRGDGTAGENFGERSCQGFIMGGFSGLFPALVAVSRGCNGDAA